jgi:pimeloyl-ACP methyl ester carboxylesterase
MERSTPVDGFSLAYERAGSGPPVVLLHGWPGDRTDHDDLVPLLTSGFEVVVPDLRGFGESDKHPEPPAEAYSAVAQARSVVALIDELGLEAPLIAGYDVGSRIAQAIARDTPEKVRALVVSPPLPGAGRRVLAPEAMAEYWYQSFHQLSLIEEVLDGHPRAVRSYLAHFWRHWSGPDFEPSDEGLDHLAAVYGAAGAMAASVAWYRAGSGMVASALAETEPDERIATPTTVLWQEHDPLFPREWSDRLGVFFSDYELVGLDGVGHFTPVEAPEAFAEAIRSRSRAAPRVRCRPGPSAPPSPPGGRAP